MIVAILLLIMWTINLSPMGGSTTPLGVFSRLLHYPTYTYPSFTPTYQCTDLRLKMHTYFVGLKKVVARLGTWVHSANEVSVYLSVRGFYITQILPPPLLVQEICTRYTIFWRASIFRETPLLFLLNVMFDKILTTVLLMPGCEPLWRVLTWCRFGWNS